MAIAYAGPRAVPCRAHAHTRGMRLTRRGRLALAGLVVMALMAIGPWRALAGSPEGTLPEGWTVVTVTPGATLWEYAAAAEGGDPRPVIAQIREVNHLESSALRAGQQLAVPGS